MDRRVQVFCATFLAVYAFLPVVLVSVAAVVPRNTAIDKFGEGHFRTKFALLAFTATLLAVGAGFRAAVAYYVRPMADPGWFHGKACYYCFNYVIELVVVFTYALTRFDKRFHIPDGSSAPGHYSGSEYGSGTGAMVANGEAARSRRKKRKRSDDGEAGDAGDAGPAEATTGAVGAAEATEKAGNAESARDSGPGGSGRYQPWPWGWPAPTLARKPAPVAVLVPPSGTTLTRVSSTKSLPSLPSATTRTVRAPSSLISESSIARDEDLAWIGRAMVSLLSTTSVFYLGVIGVLTFDLTARDIRRRDRRRGGGGP